MQEYQYTILFLGVGSLQVGVVLPGEYGYYHYPYYF